MSNIDDMIKLVAESRFKGFFHFTDARNLESIEKYGLLSAEQLARRAIKPEAPGGNNWSMEADQLAGMHRYVHLCFWDEHPMEWRAREDKRIDKTKFLRINPEVLRIEGVMVTSDVSNKSGVAPMPLDTGFAPLDLQVIYTQMDWTDDSVKERMQTSRKYELLIPDEVPLAMIENL